VQYSNALGQGSVRLLCLICDLQRHGRSVQATGWQQQWGNLRITRCTISVVLPPVQEGGRRDAAGLIVRRQF
jgi:hypothetical protein